MSFTLSGSSHLRKEQRRGWHGSRSLGWNLSGETGLEWLVGMEKIHGTRMQGGKVSWERSQCLDSPPSEHVLLTATLYWHFLQASAILHTSHRLTH